METDSTKVYLLWHVHIPPNGEEDAKLIGVYSSIAHAQNAQAKTAMLPGFKETDGAFEISCYTVDKDHWTEGFVTVD